MAMIVGLACSATVLAATATTWSADVDWGSPRWQATDALAYACDAGICVVFGKARFDRNKFMADGAIDRMDIHEGQSLDASYLELEIDPESGALTNVFTQSPSGEVNSHHESYLSSFEWHATDKGRIGGAMQYDGGDGDRIQLKFDLPIETVNKSDAKAEEESDEGAVAEDE